MKYLLIVVLSVAAGFLLAQLLQPELQSMPAQVTTVERLPVPQATETQSGSQIPDYANMDIQDVLNQTSVFEQLYLAHLIAASATVDRLKSLTLDTLAYRDPLVNYNLATIFLERLVQLDPLDTWEFVTESSGLNKSMFHQHVFTSWARNDPEAALANLDLLKGLPSRMQVLARLAADPVLADAGLTENLGSELNSQQQQMLALADMNSEAPAQAFEQALLLSGQSRYRAAFSALSRWIREDPLAALARAQQVENLQLRQMLLAEGLTQMGQQDFTEALRLGRNLGVGEQIVERIILRAALHDATDVLAEFEQQYQTSQNQSFLNEFVQAWASQDPREALAYVESLAGDPNPDLMTMVAHSYVSAYPDEALAWLLALPDRYQRTRAASAYQLATANPRLAERALNQTTDEQFKMSLVNALADQRSGRSFQEALQWIRSEFDGPGYEQVEINLYSRWLDQNPTAAMDNLLESDLLEDSRYHGSILPSAAARLVQQDQALAQEYLSRLDSESARVAYIQGMVNVLVRSDSKAAMNLVSSLADDRTRQQLTISMASTLLYSGRSAEQVISDFGLSGELREQITQLEANITRRRTSYGVGP